MTKRNYSKKTKLFAAVTLIVVILLCIFIATRKKKPHEHKITTVDKMQEMVIDISAYARKIKPGFLIIPQNGIELAFNQANPKLPLNKPYMNAIDGFGVEELFYYEKLAIDTMRLETLRKLKDKKKVLVSDFVTDDGNVADAKKRNKAEGFIPFVRSKSNYHYEKIPVKTFDENRNDVLKMSHVRNYLYLINPSNYDDKESFIRAIRKTNFDMVVVDLYFDNDTPFTKEEIQKLKVKANGGKRLVVCYMNIGAAENWRYYWKKNWMLHSPDFLERKYQGYDNEIWVEYWNPQWKRIIYGNSQSYLKKIIDAGFDGTYLDNTEAYYELYKK